MVFFIVFSGSMYAAYRFGKQKSIPPPKVADPEELRRAEKLREDFMKLMNYNEQDALNAGKVMSDDE